MLRSPDRGGGGGGGGGEGGGGKGAGEYATNMLRAPRSLDPALPTRTRTHTRTRTRTRALTRARAHARTHACTQARKQRAASGVELLTHLGRSRRVTLCRCLADRQSRRSMTSSGSLRGTVGRTISPVGALRVRSRCESPARNLRQCHCCACLL